MGFYATDTIEPAPPSRTDPGRARQHPACGRKPLRGPIHNAISGYRFYNPELGRWINRDPIGEDGGLNVYAFVGNGAIHVIDYLGKALVFAPPLDIFVDAISHFTTSRGKSYVCCTEWQSFFEYAGYNTLEDCIRSLLPQLSHLVDAAEEGAWAYAAESWDTAAFRGEGMAATAIPLIAGGGAKAGVIKGATVAKVVLGVLDYYAIKQTAYSVTIGITARICLRKGCAVTVPKEVVERSRWDYKRWLFYEMGCERCPDGSKKWTGPEYPRR